MSQIIQRETERPGEIAEHQGEFAPLPHTAEVQRSLVSILWYRRWIVFALTMLGIILGFVYVLTATPIYTSTSRVYVAQGGPKILNNDTAGYVSKSDSYLYTQAQLLGSTPILAAAIEASHASGMQTFGGADNILASLSKSLDVQVGKKDDLITVALDTPFPEEGAKLVNAIVDSFVAYQSTQNRSTAGEVLKILRKEKELRDAELAGKTKAMLDFRLANGTLSFDSQNNIVLQRLAILQQLLTQAQMDTMEAKSTYESAVAMKDAGKLRELVDAQSRKGFNVAADQRDTVLLQQLDNAELQAEQMRAMYPEANRMRVAAENYLAEMQAKIERRNREFAEGYVGALKQGWQAARTKETQVQTALNEQLKLAMDFNAKATEYQQLDSDHSRLQKLCDEIDARIRDLNVTEDVGALNINVLEVAKVEDRPTKPQKTRSLALAMVMGLMAGVGLALLRDWMDERLQSSDEIRQALDLPVLGVIPHISGRKSPQAAGQMVHLEPNSEIAEAYRTVRTAIFFGVPAGQARTMLVTSPTASDGKTTSASNIAIAMAQAGQKVLLIDADFRKPRQHVIFSIPGEAGLSAVLAQRCETKDAIHKTAVEGLHVLPCGPIPPNPAELLHSPAFHELIQSFVQQYDHVVIDSPPVMPVTDARILGAMCDITVLVLRAEKSTRRMAEHARDGLGSVGARILGVLVNDAVHTRGGYGYYNRYYGYGYGGYGGSGYGYGYGHGAERSGSNGNGKTPATTALPRSEKDA